MAQRAIIEYPDPRLREHAAPESVFGPSLAILLDDLFDTLYATHGIGLCAPQIGESRRVLVADLSTQGSAPEVYVNPVILWKKAPGLVEESCLSVPGIKGNVLRATRIGVRAQDRDGCAFERELNDMQAVCLQHELDHLDGTLFIDRLSWFRRLRLRRELAARCAEGDAR